MTDCRTGTRNRQDEPLVLILSEDPLDKEMATHSSILAEKSHRRRSLADYSLWGCKELDMTERLHYSTRK